MPVGQHPSIELLNAFIFRRGFMGQTSLAQAVGKRTSTHPPLSLRHTSQPTFYPKGPRVNGQPAQKTKPKLLDQAREILRTRRYSHRTEEAYLHWIKRYIFFHNKRHPAEMGVKEINECLTHLTTQKNVAPSTQNQACHVILFLYRHVLHREIDELDGVILAKKKPHKPEVFTPDEAKAILCQMSGAPSLMASLLYDITRYVMHFVLDN